MVDQRPFRPLYVFTDPRTGRSLVIHEGAAMPAQWDDYLWEGHPAAQEILRLVRNAATIQSQVALLRDLRSALDEGYFFVTRGGRDAVSVLLDRLNEAIRDQRSEKVRKERRS